MRLTARLFPSSALSLSLSQSKSVISCIITCIIIVPSVLLFQEVCFCLSGIACLSRALTHPAHTDTTVLAPYWFSHPFPLPGGKTCLVTFLCLVVVWGRPVLILERQQSRYSVHEEAGALLLSCHASSLIIHPDIAANLKSLKVCHREWGETKCSIIFFVLAYNLNLPELCEKTRGAHAHTHINTDRGIVNQHLLMFLTFPTACGWCQ